jgi:hypothetical protein
MARPRHRPSTPFGFYNSCSELDKTTAYKLKLGNLVKEFNGRKFNDIKKLRSGRTLRGTRTNE